jgi:ribosomal protein L11 methyltransferase
VHRIQCSVEERYVNPLFEVFDGGDFVLSSYRDIEEPFARMQIFFEDGRDADETAAIAAEATRRLSAALAIVGVDAVIETGEIADEDWKFAYRRHFKTERIGERLVVRPPWEPQPEDGVVVTLDPGMAFGTGKHETTRACLEYVDLLAPRAGETRSFLDMGCGSGILSIAAAGLGYAPVAGFDVDPEAVDASVSNARLNGARVSFVRFALGRPGADAHARFGAADVVVANILGPLLIRFADEIVPCVGSRLVVSGILDELYPEVLAAYESRGLHEVSRKTLGEWTTGLLSR